MAYKQIKLKNGLRLILVPVKGTQSVATLALCKVGSRFETKKISGASHFIEHLMFKGTERRPTTLDLSRELDSIGAEFNAATSKDWTGYHIKSSSNHLELSLDILSDMLWNSKFEPEEFKREKGVIIEEINMYEDNPLFYIDDLIEQVMFPGNTLGWEIAGTRGIIRNMERSDLVKYRNTYYQPKNMVLIIAGNFKRGEALANKYFGNLKPKIKERPRPFKKFISHKASSRPRCEIKYKNTEQVHLAVGFPGLCYEDKQMPIMQIMHIILGASMSSRLFIAIRERQGLAYYVRSSVDSYEDTGIFTIKSGLDIKRVDKAVEILKKEIEKFKKEGITAEELKRAKDFAKGKIALALEDSFQLAEFYGRQGLLYKSVKTPREKLAALNRVKAEDVRRLAEKTLDWNRAGVAVIGPFKNKNAILKYF